MSAEYIPFNKPYMTGEEIHYISEAHQNGKLAGDGEFTGYCHLWLEQQIGCKKALLTHSCTAALEMCALALDIKQGDEIIMPSFTFVSTANAFVLRGGVPVFVDIRADTLNIDESLIEQAITKKTRAIVVVHYAGVSCEMDAIMALANRYNIPVIEDAAQAILSSYHGKPLGSIGDLAALSFHETKNIMSGEGGAILINKSSLVEQCEVIREKGTDRSRFFRGEIDKYTWQSKGSSFLPGELIAAFLKAQLEHAQYITQCRKKIWNNYHKLFLSLEEQNLIRRPVVPSGCEHNAHIYYLLLNKSLSRNLILEKCRDAGFGSVFHYIPLHSSPAGRKYSVTSNALPVTDDASARLIRLPLWVGLKERQQKDIAQQLTSLITA